MLKFAGLFSQSETVQKHLIKPQIKEQLKKGTDKFDKQGRIFTKLVAFESVQHFSALYSILMQLRTKEAELFAELTSDQVLDPIVKIVGKHLKDYSSIAELKDKLKFSSSIHNMKHFGESLIDITHYLTLSKLIAKAAVIASLPELEQQSVYSAFKNGELVKLITAENNHLDHEEIKIHFENMATQLHTELHLEGEESKSLFKIYHDLTDKYLPEFNHIRHALIQVLPDFMEAELRRIEEICPHLVITTLPEVTQRTLTPSYSGEDHGSKQKTVSKKSPRPESSDEEDIHTKKSKVPTQ